MDDRWNLKPDDDIMKYLEEGRDNLLEKPMLDQYDIEPNIDELEVKKYLDAFDEWANLWSCGIIVKDAYDSVKKFEPLPETQEAVQKLLDVLPHEPEVISYAGIFISYCVNEVYSGNEIELKIDKPFCRFGTFNTKKKWKITGNVGENTGFDMEGGTIVVAGNADRWVGWGMQNGKITIEGDAGESLGPHMRGGEIFLNGEYQNISGAMRGGSVYHKGKQIYENGKAVS